MKKEYIIRYNDPYKTTPNYLSYDKDINTLGAKMVFDGAIFEFNQVFSFKANSTFNYDIIDFDGYLYIREIDQSPGSYHEKWREPSNEELDRFMSFMINAHKKHDMVDLLEKNIIYKWYLEKRRNIKIDDLFKCN